MSMYKKLKSVEFGLDAMSLRDERTYPTSKAELR